MSEFRDEFLPNPESPPPCFSQLESVMRAAGRYVQPTEDLRPNTLEAARDAYRQRRSNRRLGYLALFVLLSTATGLPGLFLSTYPKFAVVPSTELHRRASQSILENGTETNWALYEAFRDLRREHAALLNQVN